MPPTAMRPRISYWPNLIGDGGEMSGGFRGGHHRRTPRRPCGFWYFGSWVPPFDSLRRVCRDAVSLGVCPGLVVVVGSGGRNLLHDAFGHRQTDPPPLPA